MSNALQEFEKREYEIREIPFHVGDTVKVHYRIVEETTERIQIYEGVVLYIKNEGVKKSFCVRKISAASIGVERIFPFYSPRVQKVEVVRRGKVRKSKLYYLRDRVGKAAKVKEIL